RILKSWNADYYPLTLDALKRGIILNEQFIGYCKAQDDESCLQENRRASLFMSTYISYVQNRIVALDTDYRMPSYDHEYDRDYYNNDWWQSYAVAYRDAATELLGFISNGQSGRLPYSTGLDDYELRISEKILGFVAKDLNRDDFRRFYRSSFKQIRDIQFVLMNWNASREGFRNGREASNFARHEISKIRASISETPCEVENESIDDYYSRRRNSRSGRIHREHRTEQDL
ncbi:MAG: hypothetical protein ABL927_07605, partial [Bdellovibrionales bacterium]